jgi:hypothetical protein
MKRGRASDDEEEEEEEEEGFYSEPQPLQIELSKSSRSTCNICKCKIENQVLRGIVYDDVFFNILGGFRATGSGPYFETEWGTISAEKKFVHFSCYSCFTAPRPHPPLPSFYQLTGKGITKDHRAIVQAHCQNFDCTTSDSLLLLGCVFFVNNDHWLHRLPKGVKGIIVDLVMRHNWLVPFSEAVQEFERKCQDFHDKAKKAGYLDD